MAASYLCLAPRLPPSDGMDVTDQHLNSDIKQQALQSKVPVSLSFLNCIIVVNQHTATQVQNYERFSTINTQV